MKSLALALITGYQAWISPHKGYCCAYRAHTGGASCSALGYRAIRRHGLRRGLAVLRERLFLCGVAYRRQVPTANRPLRSQRGDCDPGCGDLSCDFDSGGRSRCVDALQCVDVLDCCGSDDRKRRRKGKRDADVHLPRRG